MPKRTYRLLLILGWVIALTGGPALSGESTSQKQAGEKTVGRPVDIVCLSFPMGTTMEEVRPVVEREAARGPDIIVLPEAWRGRQHSETLHGPTVTAMAEIAEKHSAYIVCPLFRKLEELRFNSAVLIDRAGKVAAVYDKMYPFWPEFADWEPPVVPGEKPVVCETDFGRVGFAICFDSNFPGLWREMAEKEAELVIWPSAYVGGRQLMAHALNHHYYIVSCTRQRYCQAFDISGRRLVNDTQDEGINVTRMTLDLDRCIFHEDFNMGKLDRLLEEHGDEVEVDRRFDREAWFILKAKRPGVSARKLAHEYDMEELRHYKRRSRRHIDALRTR